MSTSPTVTAHKPNAHLHLSAGARLRLSDRRRASCLLAGATVLRQRSGHRDDAIGILAGDGARRRAQRRGAFRVAHVDASVAAAVRACQLAVRRNITGPTLTQAQFDALVSYTYTTGPAGARRVCRRVNQGDFHGAADAIRAHLIANAGARQP